MTRIPLFVAVAWTGFLAAVAAPPAFAGGGFYDLVCYDLENYPVYIFEDQYARTNRSYFADNLNRQIVFAPHVAYSMPEPVVRLEFAHACLEYRGEYNSTCAAIQYLKRFNAINQDDAWVIEQYFLSQRGFNPEAEVWLRELYACF